MTPSDARKAMGLSIHDMALAMGVHRQTWTKWERGERRPDNAATRLMELLVWLHVHDDKRLAGFFRLTGATRDLAIRRYGRLI